MTISAMTNAGLQPPSMASLLRINKINAINGQDADGDADGSSSKSPATGAQKAIAPKLVQATLEALNQMGANIDLNAENQSQKDGATDKVKKSALDFVSSVLSQIGAADKESKYSNAADQNAAGVAQMTNILVSGASLSEPVTQSADALFKAADVPNNASSLASLLSGLQASIADSADTGNLINLTA